MAMNSLKGARPPPAQGWLLGIVSNCCENAVEYLLKEKIHNNSGFDMLRLANNSSGWQGYELWRRSH